MKRPKKETKAEWLVAIKNFNPASPEETKMFGFPSKEGADGFISQLPSWVEWVRSSTSTS